MSKIRHLLFLFYSIVSIPAFAGWQEGVEAYQQHNFDVAYNEFRPFAENGNVEAQNILGLMYEEEFRYESSVYWLRKASEKGYARAIYNLANSYSMGHGVSQSYIAAYALYDISCKDRTLFLASSARDAVGKEMNFEDIQTAKNLSKEMTQSPKPFEVLDKFVQLERKTGP